jgi:hypothetical protein
MWKPLSQYVVNGLRRENGESLIWISGIGGNFASSRSFLRRDAKLN